MFTRVVNLVNLKRALFRGARGESRNKAEGVDRGLAGGRIAHVSSRLFTFINHQLPLHQLSSGTKLHYFGPLKHNRPSRRIKRLPPAVWQSEM